jgi:hypothetical protein
MCRPRRASLLILPSTPSRSGRCGCPDLRLTAPEECGRDQQRHEHGRQDVDTQGRPVAYGPPSATLAVTRPRSPRSEPLNARARRPDREHRRRKRLRPNRGHPARSAQGRSPRPCPCRLRAGRRSRGSRRSRRCERLVASRSTFGQRSQTSSPIRKPEPSRKARIG